MDGVGVTKNIITQKPWMTSKVCGLLKAQSTAFKSGDTTILQSARANLNCAIRVAKQTQSRKVQGFVHDPTNIR